MSKLTTILLAEDEPALGLIIKESLETRGFQVLLCENGEVAFKTYQKEIEDLKAEIKELKEEKKETPKEAPKAEVKTEVKEEAPKVEEKKEEVTPENAEAIKTQYKKLDGPKITGQKIDLKQFDNWKSGLIDKNMYSAIRVLWYISGEKQDVISSNNKNLGVVSKNIRRLL